MIKAIWPSIASMPNRLPPRANITSSGLLCYFVYWIIQFPFLLPSPQRLKWLFYVKGMIVPMTWLAMVIWAFVRVPPSNGLFAEHATITGTQFSWTWLSALNSALGTYATLTVNIPDFTVRPSSFFLSRITYWITSGMQRMRERKQSFQDRAFITYKPIANSCNR